MANFSYATPTDLGTYLPGVNVNANYSLFQAFIASASSLVTRKCNQYFWSEGPYGRFFDGEGMSQMLAGKHALYGKIGKIGACSLGATSLTFTADPIYGGPAPVIGDIFTLDQSASQELVTVSAVSGTGPYTLTVGATQFQHAASTVASTIQVKLAYFENQPLAQWTVTLAGDGVNPGSNYFLWPRQRPNIESSASGAATLTRPWYGVDIAHIPVSGTSYLPINISGYDTVEIIAYWGWPAVPDEIKHRTLKVAARMWRMAPLGWAPVEGNADVGLVRMNQYLDPEDIEFFRTSDLVKRAY